MQVPRYLDIFYQSIPQQMYFQSSNEDEMLVRCTLQSSIRYQLRMLPKPLLVMDGVAGWVRGMKQMGWVRGKNHLGGKPVSWVK